MRLRGRELYYGWVQVAVLGLTETVSWGIVYYAYAVLLAPMQREMGWSTSAVTGAFSLALAVSGLAAYPVGRWLDRHGARAAMTGGSVLSVALLLAWADVRDLVGLYAVFAGLGVAMALVLYEPSFAVVATWFSRKRGQALTLLTTIAGFASTIFLPLTAWLVDRQGWRGALVTLAVVLAVATIPLHALVLRRRPEDLGLRPDGEAADERSASPGPRRSVATAEALRGTDLLVAGARVRDRDAGAGRDQCPPDSLPDRRRPRPGLRRDRRRRDRLHEVPEPAALRPARRPPLGAALTAALFAMQAAALGVLVLSPGVLGALAFAVVFGAAVGAVTTARPALLAEVYGRTNYAAISGAMTASGVVARAAAPLGIGMLFDATGTYAPVLWGLAALSLVAFAAVLATRAADAPSAAGATVRAG